MIALLLRIGALFLAGPYSHEKFIVLEIALYQRFRKFLAAELWGIGTLSI
jgi:hypothetical protein